jgi:uncharacterized membrane protein YphA (DoxX/SURF4 family)
MRRSEALRAPHSVLRVAGAYKPLPRLRSEVRQEGVTAATIARRFAWFRVVLGGLWLVDGLLELQPGVFSGFLDLVKNSGQGQPGIVHGGIVWAGGVLAHAPTAANAGLAAVEILIGLALLLGLGTRTALALSIVLSLAIWLFGQGLGGLLTGSATDVGAAPLYILLAGAVYLGGGCRDAGLSRRRDGCHPDE